MAHDIDLDTLDRSEPTALQKKVDKALKDYDTRKRAEAISAAREAAKKHGFALDDLLQAGGKGSKMKGIPRYAHLENAEKTWTGRGRKPDWVKSHLEAGGSLDDLALGETQK
ncbi:histone family protein nucleoid-structuring protein H-NS [Roseivivax marinus]|uniref:Histone family protein nucleoid-structuring protein H-NS n=1 Tax=Roseivivax marinus TaxID=1379903 RepID=W4HE66_9RHOB|nr:H-NS histone family protein [Roseivivax marinus]ETW10999.1 histone family protein nucleoid-structuring protein H-NS [Roseivivax marinus]